MNETADIVKPCLEYLQLNPWVAWAERINTGTLKSRGTGKPVSFGFVGCSDIIGQMTAGHFLAVECKQKGKEPTDEQREFLEDVESNGGISLVAESVEDLQKKFMFLITGGITQEEV